jgi:hypothetical protein
MQAKGAGACRLFYLVKFETVVQKIATLVTTKHERQVTMSCKKIVKMFVIRAQSFHGDQSL